MCVCVRARVRVRVCVRVRVRVESVDACALTTHGNNLITRNWWILSNVMLYTPQYSVHRDNLFFFSSFPTFMWGRCVL